MLKFITSNAFVTLNNIKYYFNICTPVFIAVPFVITKQPKCWLTDEWMIKRWCIYNGILLSHKKEKNWVICRDVDGPRVCHTEWSESEREKQIVYIKAGWLLNKNLLEFRYALLGSQTTMTIESTSDTKRGTQQPKIVTFWLCCCNLVKVVGLPAPPPALVQPALGSHTLPTGFQMLLLSLVSCWVGVRI